MNKAKFAVLLANRGNFPSALISQARIEITNKLNALGHEVIMLDAKETASGAVESPADGKRFASFLKEKEGEFDGVILSLPNFGSEGGIIAALKDVDVPVLIHAYPDELDKMATSTRRDAFCGKFAMMNILCQFGIKFTIMEPHVVHPDEAEFQSNIDYFSRLCLMVNGMKNFTVGVIGARTTPFKAVRFDEIALQKKGITVESLDLSQVFRKFNDCPDDTEAFRKKEQFLTEYSDFSCVPEKAFKSIVKLGVVLDDIIDEYQLDAMAVRCWTEIQEELGISPCVLLGEMNERGMTAACETDVCSAVMMQALKLAGDDAVTSLDWNNNYGQEKDKCILFHCGPVPESMLKKQGQIVDHELLVPSLGKGCSWGCDVGRIKAMPFTFAGMQTIDGQLECYIGEGKFTEDQIPEDFFGAAGVAQIENLQKKLIRIGLAGHRHHTNVTQGKLSAIMKEGFVKYLGYNVDDLNE